MESYAKDQKAASILVDWYRQCARDLPWRQNREPYPVWVSEIMLQQTRAEAVRPYFRRFLAALPTVFALAQAEEEQVLKLWEGLGYYSRARNLQKAARQIVRENGGVFPQTYAGILALPGVGPYTAGAIASICFELPVAAVDGNVLRWRARMTDDHRPVDMPQVKKQVKQELEAVYPAGACGDFTQALMELGATVCTPKSAKCALCPVQGLCLAYARGSVAELPARLPKREKRLEQRTVFLLRCQDKVALQRREGEGLLSGLWQLPNVAGTLSPAAALAQAASWGVEPSLMQREIHKEHVFTHIRWQMVCYHIQCAHMAEGFAWAALAEMRQSYALPTAFRMFLDDI
ncbi:MAG: A/G-specific adenine glycosylase [Firmicutes bacterium]|nr:A/G-specific adenine glycosylase [Bacillota bacterium]